MGSTRSFRKVLIANRGEIAMRVLRCLQEAGIASMVVYHISDRDSPAVSSADEAVEITGDTPAGAYLDMAQIVDVCQRYEVDAVHPGYGFLAESAAFVGALSAANIAFIGPSERVIDLMGDKIRSREFVAEHGFPVAPSVELDVDDAGFSDAVAHMGFPLVVKASAGGGGKGMSIVRSMDELENTLKIAASEAEMYFGDSRVYVERYFDSVHHIEVQVLGDGENVIHLGERECSIQRRFQKVIEESPSPALSDEDRTRICNTAVGIAQAANYSNAGTVEFLYTPQGEYFFLEMNTRIQVEHPVTEMVTGVDLVAEQISIAAGNPLSMEQSDVSQKGHAIECRICAEDPYDGFVPETGKVHFLKEPAISGVRFDSGLYKGQVISTAYDPMLAKLIAYADTREEATSLAIKGLQDFVLLGVNTNTSYMLKALDHNAFKSGNIDTNFVNQHADDLARDPLTREQSNALLSAALLSDRATKEAIDETPWPYHAIGQWEN